MSEIDDLEKDTGENKKLFDYLEERIPLDSMKTKGALVLEKSLHKARCLLLKTDNTLMAMINKIKNGKKDSQEPKSDNFWQNIAAKRSSENEIKIIPVKTMDIAPIPGGSKTEEVGSEKNSR